jgi:hypothetical protein
MNRKLAINLFDTAYYFMANKTGNVMNKLFVEGFLVVILLNAIIILNFSSCQTTEPPVTQGKIILEALDASSTEAWINVKLQSVNLPAELKLFREDSVTQTITLSGSDTLLYDEGLLPAKTYKYSAAISQSNNQSILSSNIVTVTTMDTTSHNFTWQTFTLGGQGGSSTLYDVAIINENDIWAVGEIHTEWTDQYDSNGVWMNPYNAVHWNGNKWELKRIMFYIDQDQPSAGKTSSPCEASFGFNDNKIAITSNVQTAIFNTNGEYSLIKMGFAWVDRFTINALWGVSSTDFYVVGNNGNIAHYDGSSWEKIESGTDVNLVDIWGTEEGEQILVCGNEDFKPTVLIELKNNKAKLLYNSRDNLYNHDFQKVSGHIRSIWIDHKDLVYILTSYDLYRIYNENLQKPTAIWKNRNKQIATLRVRGTYKNNIFTAGYEGLLYHFNGISWQTFTELYKRYKTYYSLSVGENIIVAVGRDYINGIQDKAIITLTKQ